MPLLMAVEALNLGDVLLFLLDDIGVSTCCKRVMVTTLFLSLTAQKTIFLAVLVFISSLALVDRRLLGVLATRYVSKKGVSRFISF